MYSYILIRFPQNEYLSKVSGNVGAQRMGAGKAEWCCMLK